MNALATEFGISTVAARVPQAVYLYGFAFGPVLLAVSHLSRLLVIRHQPKLNYDCSLFTHFLHLPFFLAAQRGLRKILDSFSLSTYPGHLPNPMRSLPQSRFTRPLQIHRRFLRSSQFQLCWYHFRSLVCRRTVLAHQHFRLVSRNWSSHWIGDRIIPLRRFWKQLAMAFRSLWNRNGILAGSLVVDG